jgi:O-antigen ligase
MLSGLSKMLTNQPSRASSRLALLISLAGVGVGVGVGFLVGVSPNLIVLALVGVAVLILFFAKFEQTVLGLIILRSTLDPFSNQQVPAAFAIGLNVLTLLYVIVQILLRKKVYTDKFFWIFATWVGLQGIWVLLPALGWGLGSGYLATYMREWLRIFSWAMVYLLVMQLKDRIHPRKIISALFFSLPIPVIAGFMQIFLPTSVLPSFLLCHTDGMAVIDSCITSTFGHPSGFGTFLLLFIALTIWKLGHVQERRLWIILLTMLTFLLVISKSFTSLIMLIVFIVALIAPKMDFIKLIAGGLFLAIVIGLFASTELGQERINSLFATPLLNPDMDISRTILLSFGDGNSLNWRIAHWSFLLQSWQNSPILGYGLATSPYLSLFTGYQAHNDYVRFLAEGGLVGFTLFLMFLVLQFIRLVQLLRSSPIGSIQRSLCSTMVAILVAIIVGMSSDNIWNHTTLFFYWWVILAVLGWNWEEQPNKQRFFSA